jgi:hypothetical protein
MPMGTVGHLTNGAGPSAKQSSPTAYTNGDYTPRWTSNQYPDDRISHGFGASSGDTSTAGDSTSRPLSQGVGSNNSGGQSRPSTSQGMNSSALAITPLVQGRPGSSGTDSAPHPAMRHGFAEAYSSEEYLTMLEQVVPYSAITDVRCFTCTLPLTVTRTLPLLRI